MTPTYAPKLGLISGLIDINTQKIDVLVLKTYEIITAGFFLQDSQKKI